MTAVVKIAEWINQAGRPVWWRHAVRLLLEHQSLTNEDYLQLYRLARKGAGFTEDIDDTLASKPVEPTGFEVEEHPTTLLQLGPTQNVAALQDTQKISFQPSGLNVVYGDNGSGKSSYARVLKAACTARGGSTPVIGNAFRNSVVKPSATILYQQENDSPREYQWSNEAAVEQALKAVRVFDSAAAFHYVEKEGEIDYRPAGLHLLDELVNVCEFVKSEAEQKLTQLRMPKPLPVIPVETDVGKFLRGITANTSKEELASFLVTDDDRLTLTVVRKELAELQRSTVEQLRKDARARLSRIKPLVRTIEIALQLLSDESAVELQAIGLDEPPRVSWRLHYLREWSHEEATEVFP